MSLEERVDRLENSVSRLVSIQQQTVDVLGLSVEGQRRLAERTERLERSAQETTEKLNALIDVVDGIIHGKQQPPNQPPN